MTIIARYHGVPVEIIDQPYEMAGVKLVTVKAFEGRPFVGGDKWPVRTAYATAKVSELTRYEKPAANLLQLALDCERPIWPTGEVVHLTKQAFLKNVGGFVDLCIAGYRPSLTVFWLDLYQGKWNRSRDLETKYQEWAAKARREVAK